MDDPLPPAKRRRGADNADSATTEGAVTGDNSSIKWFIYVGQPNSEIPRNVTHVRIDPSVKIIPADAFRNCQQLVELVICEGLEQIGRHAFAGCKSLKRFKAPSTLKVIAGWAFFECKELVKVELCEGLETVD